MTGRVGFWDWAGRTKRRYNALQVALILAATAVAFRAWRRKTAHEEALARLERAADFVSAEHRYVVCQTPQPAASATRGVLNLASAIERLRKLGRTRRNSRARPRRRASPSGDRP